MDENPLKKNKVEILVFVIFMFVLLYVNSVYSILFISGSSMNPTFNDKEIVILKKEENIERGQIVVFEPPVSWDDGKKDKFVKRVIGLPGDTITIKDGDLYVNGELESAEAAFYCDDTELVLPERRFFFVGDNYGKSKDSLMQLCTGDRNYDIRQSDIVAAGYESFRIGVFAK